MNRDCLRPVASGMTLLELLVAFFAFVLLVMALVSMSTSALDTWTEGEGRKDTYDRAQTILQTVGDDLRNAYFESDWKRNGTRYHEPPALLCDTDRNRRSRLRFVCSGKPVGWTDPAQPGANLRVAEDYFGERWEVAYLMSADRADKALYRGAQPFERSKQGSLLDDDTLGLLRGRSFDRAFTKLDGGVLYLGFRFWSQDTKTWDERERIVHQVGRTVPNHGPTFEWDSSRIRNEEFYLYRKRNDRSDPDFVMPERVQIHLTLESNAPGSVSSVLVAAADSGSLRLQVSTTRGLPGKSGFIQVGSEWMEVRELRGGEIALERRGARGTKPESHETGEGVLFGPTFVTEVDLPVHREAVYP